MKIADNKLVIELDQDDIWLLFFAVEDKILKQVASKIKRPSEYANKEEYVKNIFNECSSHFVFYDLFVNALNRRDLHENLVYGLHANWTIDTLEPQENVDDNQG